MTPSIVNAESEVAYSFQVSGVRRRVSIVGTVPFVILRKPRPQEDVSEHQACRGQLIQRASDDFTDEKVD